MASRIDATRAHAIAGEAWVEDDGYDAATDWPRLFLRDDPDQLEWLEDDDRVIRSHFGRTKIEEIALLLHRSESAVAYRARELGLRNIPKYYDIRKVALWLGLKVSDALLMKRIGLEVFPCCDRNGKVKITLVSTTSLARCLLRKKFWRTLVDKYDADEFFIRDVIESVVELQRGEAVWEPSPWVSHGHVSLNPYSPTCFGLFFDGNDSKMAGQDLDPRDLHPSAQVTSDEWRRGAHGTDSYDKEVEEFSPTLLSHAPSGDAKQTAKVAA